MFLYGIGDLGVSLFTAAYPGKSHYEAIRLCMLGCCPVNSVAAPWYPQLCNLPYPEI